MKSAIPNFLYPELLYSGILGSTNAWAHLLVSGNSFWHPGTLFRHQFWNYRGVFWRPWAPQGPPKEAGWKKSKKWFVDLLGVLPKDPLFRPNRLHIRKKSVREVRGKTLCARCCRRSLWRAVQTLNGGCASTNSSLSHFTCTSKATENGVQCVPFEDPSGVFWSVGHHFGG